MIPLWDDNPSSTRPVVNYLIIITCVLVFLHMLGLVSPNRIARFTFTYGAVPAQITGRAGQGGAGYSPLVTSTFVHGGWVHLLGNMLYLWIFGDNVEDAMGHGGYLIFYLLSGVLATITHVLVNPNSTVPVVGASGAIAGVLGAYLVLFPRARIFSLIPFGFLFLRWVPAIFFLPIWFLMQFFTGLAAFEGMDIPVAWDAHIGGFVTGLVLVFVFARRSRRPVGGWG